MDLKLVLLRAAQLLELHAEELRRSHTLAGGASGRDEDDQRARAEYDESAAIVAKLRLMAQMTI